MFSSFIPTCLIKNENNKKIVEHCEEFYPKLLSAETIVNNVIEVDKLKKILFQDESQALYNEIELHSSNQKFFNYWLKEDEEGGQPKVDIMKLKNSGDYISQILVNRYDKYP